jgi:hypothetical protein
MTRSRGYPAWLLRRGYEGSYPLVPSEWTLSWNRLYGAVEHFLKPGQVFVTLISFTASSRSHCCRDTESLPPPPWPPC